MQYTKEELLRERERRQFVNAAKQRFTPEALNQEKERRRQQDLGASGIWNDIKSGASAVPGALWNMAKGLPNEVMGAGEQIFNDPGRVGKNALRGLYGLGQGVLNTPANIGDYLARKEVISPEYEGRIPRQNHPESFNQILDNLSGITAPEQRHDLGSRHGDELIKGVTEFLPYMFGGELGQVGNLARAGLRTGMAGAHAVGQNENPITAMGAFAPIEGAMQGLNKARPSTALSKFGERASPEMLERARVAEGTKTPLGDVIKSPSLKKYFENELSGTEPILTELGEHLTKKGEGLFQGAHTGDANQLVESLMQKGYKKEGLAKNALYEDVTKQANKEGLLLELPNFSRFARQNKEAIAESPMLKNDAKFRKMVNQLSRLESVTTESPGKTTYPSLKTAKMTASQLYNEGERMLKSPAANDRALGGLYKKLGAKLKEDIKTNLKEKASPELQVMASEADKVYQNSFAKFLDKELYPYSSGSKDAQSIIHDIVKPGKAKDKYQLIEKAKQALPKDQQGALGMAYLQQAFDKQGAFSPGKLNQLLDGLGKRQFKALFDKPMQRQLLDYQRLTKMNGEALNRMANPKTGARTNEKLNKIMTGLQGVGGLAAGLHAGGTLGGILGGVGLPLLSFIKDKALKKWLTDQVMRESVVNQKFGHRPKTPFGSSLSNIAPKED